MSTHLITGYAGKEHITAADQGSYNAAVMGDGEFALERGEQFRCQVVSNNKVRIYDGDALMQGRHIIIDRNTYEETTHDNGTQGYKRIDLIVLTYEKNAVTSVESVKVEVIKGAPSESNPTVPEYTKGDILNSGASKNQMPLYQIPFDGLSIGEPVKLFSTVPTLEGMKADIDGKVDEKIAEFEEDFAELEAGIEDKIAEAGKPLASNADDWALIENYGEYSADAKTVGEEFAKVNNSLTASDNLKFKFATDGEGNYGYLGADGSLIPFKKFAYGTYTPKSTTEYMEVNLGFRPRKIIFYKFLNSSVAVDDYDDDLKTLLYSRASSFQTTSSDLTNGNLVITDNGFQYKAPNNLHLINTIFIAGR